jgi:hypothetical protein
VEAIVERPAALDVHKAQVTACVRVPASGGRREQHVAEFAKTASLDASTHDDCAAAGSYGATAAKARLLSAEIRRMQQRQGSDRARSPAWSSPIPLA